jgi:hypothetical protein
MTLKVASGSRGFYLYCEIEDDNWLLPSGGGSVYDFDAIDILFDRKSAAEIATSLPLEGSDMGLTSTSQQYQIWLGSADVLPSSMIFNAQDPDWGTFEFGPINEKTFVTMLDTFGVKVEVIKVDNTHKVVEWFIPFAHLGITDGSIAKDTRIGFCAGYNDRDALSNETVAALRLKDGSDPISGIGDETFEQRVLHWGEIVFTADVEIGVNNAPAFKNNAFKGEVVATEFYTLQGEKIAAKNVTDILNHSVVVQRSVLKNGNIVAERISLTR